MSLIDEVQQHLGPTEIEQISQQLGIDATATQTAVQSALPMMVAGMAGNAQQPAGESQIQSLLGSHGGILGSLASAISGGASGGGGGVGDILGSILGQHHETVENGVTQSSGLKPDQTKRLLMILAPIVLAVLAKRHANNANSGNAGGLGGALQKDAQSAQQSGSPHVGGILGKILSHVQTS